jgi:DNA-binding PadR family transcriptional regulator
MDETTRDPGEMLPLPLAVLHILLALSDSERHGYGVMQEVAAFTEGRVRLGPGTLYGAIKRMLADRLIEEIGDRPDPSIDDERRRYYRMTGLGRQVLTAELERLAQLVDLAKSRGMLSEMAVGAAVFR